MSSPRKVALSLTFNGSAVKLTDRIETLSYTDVASGSSDSLEITVRNDDFKWLNSWLPKKGSKIAGKVVFQNWNAEGKNLKLNLGTHVLDDNSFSGGPLTAKLSALSKPASENFSSRERTKTWKKVTLKKIGQEIAGRYSLSLVYDAPTVSITAKEQSEKTDSAFLTDLCKDYGLGFKIYNSKLVIYNKTKYEKKEVVATLTRESFVDDQWDYADSLYGTYTGARISYKQTKKNKKTSSSEISIYVGLQSETAKGSRVLKINEQADSKTDAQYKAKARVDESNEQATTISGTIWANPKIAAGTTVQVKGMYSMNGKYFVDQVTTEVSSGSPTVMKVEMHKCYTRLSFQTASKKTTTKSSSKKTTKKKYKVGDIVTFNGGKHYVSSYSGAKGYTVSAGKAKITAVNGSGKAHPYHLVTQNWSQTHVWGWVDSGTFS